VTRATSRQKWVISLLCIFSALTIWATDASAGATASKKPAVQVNQALSRANVAVVKCWATPFTAQRIRRSSVGIVVWRYRLTIDDFCWNGTQIVLVNSHRSTYQFGLWVFSGHIDNEVQRNAKWSWRRFTEGKFTWIGEPLPFAMTPEVWIYLRGDGYHSWGTAL